MFVGDAKYKKTKSDDFPNADIYQVLSYAVAARLPTALLVYAEGEDEPREIHVDAAGKVLQITSVRLAGTPDEVLESISRVAERVRAMSSAAVELAAS